MGRTLPAATQNLKTGAAITRIAAGVDGYPEGRDAAALGAILARATGAELMLVAVYTAPLFSTSTWNWTTVRKDAERWMRDARRQTAPDARTVVESHWSIPRALHDVIGREHRDLLVVGSSRQAADGHVRIGKRTRQLLSEFDCPLAVAPRGLHTKTDAGLARIGVGYDAGPESDAALALARWLASTARAELRICGVVDDRVPFLLRSALRDVIAVEWHDVIEEEERMLRSKASAAAHVPGAQATVEIFRGRPADALLALSAEVDLMLIGSRRWGPAARVLLGATGEAVMHDAACPVLVMPRPAS
jgi:nucleotide-binding universal stress UspA family protein